jgi:LysR family hydrogen peroxide-inducible transcriptional activator
MNSRTLEYVVAVYETGSLRAAAERCHATPATLSAQISRLEDYLGVRIFESRSHPAPLTVDGERLLPEVREAVRHLHRLLEAARRTHGSADG